MDRGKNGLECMCLLLAYKIKYPENFFLLRGNHECASINRIYGFYDECAPPHRLAPAVPRARGSGFAADAPDREMGDGWR